MLNLFNSKKDPNDLLDQTLYTVPGTNTPISWADITEGTLIMGSTGSGKSSGPGRFIAHAMLKSGFGMCILCAKNDERQRWLRYIEEAAPERKKDLVIFGRKSRMRFNILQYEMERSGEGAGDILNGVEALMSLNEQNQNHLSGMGSGKEERFWNLSLRRLISRSILTLKLAGEPVTIPNMRKLVSDCFKGEEVNYYRKLEAQSNDEKIDRETQKKATKTLDNWIDKNYFLQILLKLANIEEGPIREIDMVMNYWMNELPKIGEKATSILVESFMGIAEPFLNPGILKDQFSHGLDEKVLPDNIVNKNAIVICDFPVKEFGIAGIFAQTIYKIAFQSAMERRNIETEKDPKPVGLWIDEYQQFCTHKDHQFQATARSSWVATVYITQNLPGLFPLMGNTHSEAKAKSLLGNLNLKYFASNDNYETNFWASQMIGQHRVDLENLSYDKDMQISKSKNQQMMDRVTPDHFTKLKTGRKANNHIVEAIVFKAGKTWGKDKRNFALVGFKQR